MLPPLATSFLVSILVVLDDWFGPIDVYFDGRTPADVSILVVLDDWFGPL